MEVHSQVAVVTILVWAELSARMDSIAMSDSLIECRAIQRHLRQCHRILALTAAGLIIIASYAS